MKAMVLEQVAPIETEPLAHRDVEDPQPSAGEVVIDVAACGVCRSNLHMVEGDWLPGTPATLPIVPGHEVVGKVSAVGAGVGNVAVGDRVGVQPIWSTCGWCRYCLQGREQLCRQRQITGETRDGGYAERMLADARHVFPIPAALSDLEATPLFCPGITAYGAVKKAAPGVGSELGVIGVGGVGHLVIQLARLAGAEVSAITRSASNKEIAEEAGATRIGDPKGSDGSHLPDASLDSVIVFAPSDAAVAEAMRLTRPGGRIVLGVAQSVGTLDIGDETMVLGSVLGNRWEMLEVLELAAAGRIRAVQSSHALEEANRVLRRLKEGDIVGRAVLVP